MVSIRTTCRTFLNTGSGALLYSSLYVLKGEFDDAFDDEFVVWFSMKANWSTDTAEQL